MIHVLILSGVIFCWHPVLLSIILFSIYLMLIDCSYVQLILNFSPFQILILIQARRESWPRLQASHLHKLVIGSKIEDKETGLLLLKIGRSCLAYFYLIPIRSKYFKICGCLCVSGVWSNLVKLLCSLACQIKEMEFETILIWPDAMRQDDGYFM